MDSNKSYIALMAISVVCLIAIISSVTYAYFKTRIDGSGAKLNIVAGTVKININEEKIDFTGAVPILDSTSDTKAQKNTFTVSRTDDSNLDACYSLFLVVDSIGDKIKNGDFKYSLTYGSSKIDGTFDGISLDENGKATITLLANQSLTSDEPSKEYTLRLWLSYASDRDQTSMLQGDESTRKFVGHLKASGQSGLCKVE